MSLTSNLKDTNSPLSLWMDRTFDRKAITDLVGEVNDQLSRQPPLIGASHNAYALVGTAFDFLFRWQFGTLKGLGAVAGAVILSNKHKQAVPVVEAIIRSGDQVTDDITARARYAVMLSWFDWVYRSRRIAPELASALRKRNTNTAIHTLHNAIPPGVIDDLLALYETIPAVWDNALQQSAVLNPSFAGSSDVGGADADWIIDGTLYDCKVSKQTRPFSRKEVLQVVGYVLLDYDNVYQIAHVGWYYARQRTRIAYPLDELLPRLGVERSMSDLRDELRSLLSR